MDSINNMKQTERKLYVVGIGPGSYEQMTIRAEHALKDCEVIAGYTVYVDLVRPLFPEKQFLITPMTQETKRCRMAFEEANQGKCVAMICSGDSGIYGMAGLILQMASDFPEVKVEIIPGVTAALSGGAVLGAPLGHDFAVISLSDLLTPMDVIEKRLRCAAEGDFAICIYNPSSKKRFDYLRRACEIILEYQSGNTVCGLVKNIGREGQAMEIMTLEQLKETETDMFTTVYIGNSRTEHRSQRMVTPRGYRDV